MNLKLKKRITINILAFSIILIILSIGLHYWTGGNFRQKHGIVIDSNSFETNFFLYDWSSLKINNTGIVGEVELVKTKTRLTDDPEPIFLINNLDKLIRLVNYNRHKIIIPIYLGATSGMRLLYLENKEKAKKIIQNIKDFFEKYTKLREDLIVKEIEIISEIKEALYCWISANYNMGFLNPKERYNQSFGILDLGEISTQIAFSIKSSYENKLRRTEIVNKKGIEKIKLFGIEHEVYTHSNFCFGIDQVINRYLIGLIIESVQGVSTIENPCSHKDQPDLTMKKEELLSSYCTNNEFIQKLIILPSYTFHSVPNIKKCKKMTEKLVDVNYNRKVYQDYFFQPIHQILPNKTKFYALNNFFKSVSRIKKSEIIKFKDEIEFITKIEIYCKKPWHEIIKDHKEQENFFKNYCFSLNYIFSFLKNVYNFDGPKFGDIEFRSKLNGNDLSWSLGYMLQATNSIPGEFVDPNLNTTGFVIIIFISLLLLIGSLFTLYKKNFFREPDS